MCICACLYVCMCVGLPFRLLARLHFVCMCRGVFCSSYLNNRCSMHFASSSSSSSVSFRSSMRLIVVSIVCLAHHIAPFSRLAIAGSSLAAFTFLYSLIYIYILVYLCVFSCTPGRLVLCCLFVFTHWILYRLCFVCAFKRSVLDLSFVVVVV